MRKRLLVLMLVSMFFLVNSAFAQCSLDDRINDCPVFSNTFNSFNLDFSDQEEVLSYEASIYKKDNPANKLIVMQDGNSVRNLNPFTEPGVYVLKVDVLTKARNTVTEEFEYVFDNSEPLAPIIPLNLRSGSGSISIEGRTEASSTVVAEDLGGNVVNTASDASGDFILNLNLQNGWNYYKFYTIRDGRRSVEVQRVIYSGSYPVIDVNSVTGSIDLESPAQTNARTTEISGTYVTTKRDFYIQGTLGSGVAGIPVYINGARVLSDPSGRFGGLVLLNEGQNKIIVKAGSQQRQVLVDYVPSNFKFFELEHEKSVSSDELRITGKTNYDLPFQVYLNGKHLFEQVSSSGNVDFTLTGLREGKNYIYIEGYNSEVYNDIVYLDTQNPVIESLSAESVSIGDKELVFRIKDDTGVEFTSFDMTFSDSKRYFGSDIEVRGDIFIVDLKKHEEGSYSYDVEVQDSSGRIGTFSGSITISPTSTMIETIYPQKGAFVGDTLFVKKGVQRIDIIPSRHIAFKKIYIDGEEQINYSIKPSGDVELHAEFKAEEGEMEFIFINNDYEEFTKIITYRTDEKNPELELDYIYRPYVSTQAVKITGKITDPYFDWESLGFNSQRNVVRYGDYFEAYVYPPNAGENNLLVNGKDLNGNILVPSMLGGLMVKESVVDDIVFEDVSSQSFKGQLSGGNSRVKNYASSYDGMDVKMAYISTDFELPASDREGVRSVNLKGVRGSDLTISDYSAVSIDGSEPELYHVSYGSDRARVIIDGTLSPVVDSSISIMVNSQEVPSYSFCSNYQKPSVYSRCVEVPSQMGDQVVIRVEDDAGNTATKTFTVGEFNEPVTVPTQFEIYFTGNDKVSKKSSAFIQGQIKSSVPVTEVKVGNRVCAFDDFNFVCEVYLVNGDNDFEVIARNSNSETVSSSYSIFYDNSFEVEINDISGDALVRIGSDYYTVSNNLFVSGDVSKEAIVKLLIDGNSFMTGVQDGEFTVPMDLRENVLGKNEEELEIRLQAEDEQQRKVFSEKLKVIYNRISKTIVDIVVG